MLDVSDALVLACRARPCLAGVDSGVEEMPLALLEPSGWRCVVADMLAFTARLSGVAPVSSCRAAAEKLSRCEWW